MSDIPAALTRAVGKRIAVADVVTATPVAAMMATFDRAGPPPGPGEAIPALWHGLFCTAALGPEALGPDGMARDEPLLPAVPGYPRRRFGGARFAFPRPIRIGETIRRVSEIACVEAKTGRAGPFLRARVRHMIEGPGGPATIEENDVLFLPPAGTLRPTAADAAPGGPPGRPAFSRAIAPDPVLLFRHSALTFNAHRIHYDRGYARAQGEPGLLVQGILIARLMLEAVHAERPGQAIARFSFHAAAPVHDTAPFTIAGTPGVDQSTLALRAVRADGRVAMTAEVGFEVP